MSRENEAPRCATCGHGYDWHVATGTMVHCRGCCGTGRECVHAFVPPADAKPAEAAEWCERCGRERDAHNGRHLCSTFVEPAPRAKPAEAVEDMTPEQRGEWFTAGMSDAEKAAMREPAPRAQPAEAASNEVCFHGRVSGRWVLRSPDNDYDAPEWRCDRCGVAFAPAKPPAPAALREAAERFCAAIEGYGETGVWPSNGELVRHAAALRAALREER